MITVIRNDHKARFAHDVYDIKIKEEKPMFKLIGTTRNEGVCLYESPSYGAVAHTFDKIVDAIMNGEKSIMILPPVHEHKPMSKEEFDCCEIHDLHHFDEDHPIPPGHDMYGRRITEKFIGDNNCHTVNETPNYIPQGDNFFYNWQDSAENMPMYSGKNSPDNRFLNNIY